MHFSKKAQTQQNKKSTPKVQFEKYDHNHYIYNDENQNDVSPEAG